MFVKNSQNIMNDTTLENDHNCSFIESSIYEPSTTNESIQNLNDIQLDMQICKAVKALCQRGLIFLPLHVIPWDFCRFVFSRYLINK